MTRLSATILFLASCLAFAPCARAGRPPLVIPTSPAAVLERLPHGYASLEPVAARAGTAVPPTLAQVERLVNVAARSGDARLAARAQALLDHVPPGAGADAATPMRMRSYLAQHRHDFSAALRILDAMLQRWPRDGDARLSRAQIQLVQGRLDLARGDCAVLSLGVDSGRGMLCIAALSFRQGRDAAAARVAGQWLAQAPPADPARRYVLVMRGEIASHAREPDADRWFAQALALAPDDVRTLAARARHLRAAGRPADVLRLLAVAPATDTLQLERVLAARALGLPSAKALADGQARRYALAREIGSTAELREEAEFLLTVRAQPAQALSLALENFRQQRDIEDVDLLVRAATAASRPDALRPMQAWARAQGLAVPVPGRASTGRRSAGRASTGPASP